MLRKRGTAIEVTGHGWLDLNDFARRKGLRSAPAEGRAFDLSALEMPALQSRLETVVGRDSSLRRGQLANAYGRLQDVVQSVLPALNSVRRTTRDMKPEAARKQLETAVPGLLFDLHGKLAAGLREVAAGQVMPARARLAAVFKPDAPTDTAAALVQAIRAMEVRQRIAGLPENERMKAVSDLGRDGRIAELSALTDDPLGCPVRPELMEAAQATCRAAICGGADVLAEDEDDAQDSLKQLAVVSDLLLGGLVQHLGDLGVPADLLRDPGRPALTVVAHDAANAEISI